MTGFSQNYQLKHSSPQKSHQSLLSKTAVLKLNYVPFPLPPTIRNQGNKKLKRLPDRLEPSRAEPI